MFNFKQQPRHGSDKKDKTIKFLTLLLLAAIAGLSHAHYLLATIPKDFTAHLPPDLSQGGVIRFNEWQPHTVYAFAFRVHQSTYRCKEDCSKEFKNNVLFYGYYYTDRYREQLVKLADQQQNVNRGRIRTVSEWFAPDASGGFSPDKVVPLGNDSWVVYIDVEEVDRIGGKIVRDVIIRYPLLVKRWDVDRNNNPWKLGIDGMYGNPVRIE